MPNPRQIMRFILLWFVFLMISLYCKQTINPQFQAYPDLPTNRFGNTPTSSETFAIISQVYIEFRVFRSELIEKGDSDLWRGQGRLI
jgi:hypothetical protein